MPLKRTDDPTRRIPAPSPLGEGVFIADANEKYEYAIESLPHLSEFDDVRARAEFRLTGTTLAEIAELMAKALSRNPKRYARRFRRLCSGAIQPKALELVALQVALGLPEHIEILNFEGLVKLTPGPEDGTCR